VEIYLTRNHRSNEAGHIYEYSDAEAASILAEGLGVKVDFPTVQGYSREINNLVANYRMQRDHLATTDRYRDNESERTYQMQKLKLDLDKAVAEKKEAYAVELEALYRQNAAAAFEVKIDEGAKSFVDAVKTQFSLGANTDDLADMLVARLKSATPEEKAALSLSLKEIPIPEAKRQKVESQLKGSAPGESAMLNCKILREYHATQNPATSYDQLKAVAEGVKREVL
jgi:hypothetical protein